MPTSSHLTLAKVEYSRTDSTLVDYKTYYAVLGDGRSPLSFQVEYSGQNLMPQTHFFEAKSAYNLTDMSPSSWLESWQNMHTDDLLWNNFKTFYTTRYKSLIWMGANLYFYLSNYCGSYPWTCTGSCKTEMLARIGMDPKATHLWPRPHSFIGPPLVLLKKGHTKMIWNWQGKPIIALSNGHIRKHSDKAPRSRS